MPRSWDFLFVDEYPEVASRSSGPYFMLVGIDERHWYRVRIMRDLTHVIGAYDEYQSIPIHDNHLLENAHPSTNAIIVLSKTGSHVYPVRPDGFEED